MSVHPFIIPMVAIWIRIALVFFAMLLILFVCSAKYAVYVGAYLPPNWIPVQYISDSAVEEMPTDSV